MFIHLCFSFFLTCAAYAHAASRGPVVNTTSGMVRGYWPHDSVQAFLGIPYAQPPLGRLRFRAPQTFVRNSSGVLDATEFGYSCFQAPTAVFTNTSFPPSTGQSEDCLTLNVWSASERSSALKPVYIFVHGGSFAEGGTSVPLYSGFEIAKQHQDIVVVTFNYRLNIFGFPNAPGLTEQNLGLRDIRFAIEWLHDNIAAVGGDPEQMVAGGQSAGSIILSMYPYANVNDPILKGLILESGSITNGFIALNNGTYWREATKLTNCTSPNTTAEQEVECMRSVEPLTLVRTFSPSIVNPLEANVVFFPIEDNATAFGYYTPLTSSGKLAKIPVLIGSNKNEMDNLVKSSVNGVFDANLTALLGDKAFTCAASSQAAALANSSIPVWRYHFAGTLPFSQPYPWVGAYHGAELPLVLANYKSVQVRDPQPYEVAAGRFMQNAWLSFVRDPQNGLTRLGWPKYNPDSETLIQILPNNTASARFIRRDSIDANCSPPPPS